MMYQDTTVTGMSKEGATVREKAAAMDDLNRQKAIDAGVEEGKMQLLMDLQARQRDMDRQMRQGAANYQKNLQQPVEQPSFLDIAKQKLSSFITGTQAPTFTEQRVQPYADAERMMEEERLNKIAQEADRTAQGYK
jgi:hypothetical protein